MFYPKTPFYGKGLLLENEILKINTTVLTQLLPWLCMTPRITTYRINTLRIAVTDYKTKLEAKLSELFGKKSPRVYTLQELPEMLCIAPLEQQPAIQQDNSRKEVIVDTSCGAALLRGAHIYSPGVLAMESGTQLHEIVNVFADLPGKCKYGTATRYECSEKIFLGVGQVLMQRHQLYNKNGPSMGIAVCMQTTISGVPSLGDLSDADALLQNLPSIVCVRVLDPKPGERILDMCAAPGNKTTHIAELMGDVGSIIALDNSASRMRAMQGKIKNYSSIKGYRFDATKACDSNGDINSGMSDTPPYAPGSFDRILLDAPCSGLGNRPQLCCNIKEPKVLKSFPHIQRNLLSQAVPLLRPGGVLVYSTCTVTEAECEEMVAWTLRKFPQMQLIDATPKLGAPGLPIPQLDSSQCALLQRFGSCGQNLIQDLDTVGFFIAKFQKALASRN